MIIFNWKKEMLNLWSILAYIYTEHNLEQNRQNSGVASYSNPTSLKGIH